jgi:hypothetical protein
VRQSIRFTRSHLAAAMFLAVGLVGSASAATISSDPTDTVIGRAPVVAPTIANQTRPGEPPVDGEIVVVTPNFTDLDGDADRSTYVWKRDGALISGASSTTYTLTPADLGTTLSVEVTPVTDSAITEPFEGDMVAVEIAAGDVAGGKPLSIAIHSGGAPVDGSPIVGDTLTAVPTCATTCDSNLVYTWTVGGVTVSESSANYVVKKEDQKKAIVVSAPDVKAVQR